MSKKEAIKTRAQSAADVVKGLYTLTLALAELFVAYNLYFQQNMALKVAAVVLLSHAALVLTSKFVKEK